MGADPEPDELLTGEHGNGAVMQTDPYRVDRWCRFDLLELETRMIGVFAEEPVGLPGVPLDGLWQRLEGGTEPLVGFGDQSRSGSRSWVKPARCSFRASSASRASKSPDLAKASS